VERIQLQEPELVAMRPEEHREAVCLLAAFIRAVRSSLVGNHANLSLVLPVGSVENRVRRRGLP
jgi:hypothetical protein